MKTVVMCKPDQFCKHQKETGGEIYEAPLVFWCMADTCEYPGKLCLYIEHGGKRPQDSE